MSRTPRSNPDVGYGRPMPWIDLGREFSVRELDASRWQPQGSCADSSSWLWFEDANSPKTRRAETICKTCPVRRTCLAAALVYAEEFGVWGGVPACKRRPLLVRLASGELLGTVLDDALEQQDPKVA
ncbi:WhiB family transcriptional regulator [Pedococcus bigeumensis]|uniref:Transcriptional regulator WhiB n=2 Tax=Pedococcus bigeumensis TaxID=433644 RepID=A0A502CMJ3_9MICO|nr:WhiB family transcriptional regulator [Pedococcus bigeumensis]